VLVKARTKGTGLVVLAGKEDPVELYSSLSERTLDGNVVRWWV